MKPKDVTRKHAYLIIAHNNVEFLKRELQLLDDSRNDIYLHLDCKMPNVTETELKGVLKQASLFFVDREDVKWGGYSIVRVTMSLLKAAYKRGPYSFYHLISGADLPLHSQDYIHDFFDAHEGFEFVAYDRPVMLEQAKKRVSRFYLFQDLYGRKHKKFPFVMFYVFERIFLKLQDLCKVDRFAKENIIVQKGPEWFSITNVLVKEILSKEEWIKKHFQFTRCADEVFVQTVLRNSDRKDYVYMNGLRDAKCSPCMRYIDWKRGKPYTWREEDYDELVASPYLFARKFDPNVDAVIFDRIIAHIEEEECKGM